MTFMEMVDEYYRQQAALQFPLWYRDFEGTTLRISQDDYSERFIVERNPVILRPRNEIPG